MVEKKTTAKKASAKQTTKQTKQAKTTKPVADQITLEETVEKATTKISNKPEQAPVPAPKKQKKPEVPIEPVYRVQPEQPTKAKKRKSKKHKSKKRELMLSLDKNTPFVYQEAYKSLRTNVNFISSTSDVKSVIITSAIPQESKSNVAVNLAINMASEGKKVILVDCDLRKPMLHKYLHMGRTRFGLTDVLTGRAELSDCVVRFKDVKISALPAGTIPPNPSEILAQAKMQKLVDALKEKYDFVILDAPPVSVVTDAAVLGHYVDGAILVVRSRFAPKETIQLAKRKLENVEIKILGVVLTRYNAKGNNKSSAYSYTYGYGYGYGYGDDDG